MSTLFLVIVGSLLLGVLLNLAAFIWTCVVACRHTAWWLLAFFLIPFGQAAIARFVLGPEALNSIGWIGFLSSLPLARAAFAGKHWADARSPMGLTAVALAMIWVPLGLYRDQLVPLALQAAQARAGKGTAAKQGVPGPGEPPTASEAMQRETAALADTERRQRQAQETRVAYDKHRAEADALFKELNTRRAKLKVDDAKAVAAFNADAARYAALLEQAKGEHDALDTPGAPAPVAVAPLKAPTTSPAAKRGPVFVPGVVGGNPIGTKAAEPPSLPRRALDKARVARDAASAAEDAGPFAGEVYGPTGPGAAPSPSPRR